MIQADSSVVYVHSDHLATPRLATNADGVIVWRWISEAFGEGLPNEDVDGDGSLVIINHRFPGQYLDRESELSYNYFRDYDAGLGRYVQSDPIGLAGGINTFGYVGQGPLGYVDPLGLNPIAIGSKAIQTIGKVGSNWWSRHKAAEELVRQTREAAKDESKEEVDRDEAGHCPNPGDPEDDPGCVDRMVSQGWSYVQAAYICRGPTNTKTGDNRLDETERVAREGRDSQEGRGNAIDALKDILENIVNFL